MSQTVYFDYFNMIIDELIHCNYCEHEIENKELNLCLGCELSLELTEALIAFAEA
jgi:hypothetical protein